MRILLDTNAISFLMRGRADVELLIRSAEEVLLSSIVLGEVLYGFRVGSRWEENLRRLEVILSSAYVTFLPVTEITADRYARIYANLRAKGRSIPTNDVWIAAHTMESGSDLLSSDKHFEYVDGIVLRKLDAESRF